ncbi:uncharacterized protein [Melanerpes formicivorus]|uniref:uncharacterized protein n=1 Tax=Melanerpes formicivorus TaxID=211600 RepID=UPI00358F7B25
MDRQAAYDLFKCFLEKRQCKLNFLKKRELVPMLEYAEEEFPPSPHSSELPKGEEVVETKEVKREEVNDDLGQRNRDYWRRVAEHLHEEGDEEGEWRKLGDKLFDKLWDWVTIKLQKPWRECMNCVKTYELEQRMAAAVRATLSGRDAAPGVSELQLKDVFENYRPIDRGRPRYILRRPHRLPVVTTAVCTQRGKSRKKAAQCVRPLLSTPSSDIASEGPDSEDNIGSEEFKQRRLCFTAPLRKNGALGGSQLRLSYGRTPPASPDDPRGYRRLRPRPYRLTHHRHRQHRQEQRPSRGHGSSPRPFPPKRL